VIKQHLSGKPNLIHPESLGQSQRTRRSRSLKAKAKEKRLIEVIQTKLERGTFPEKNNKGRTKSAMNVKIAYDAEILKYAGYMITA